MGAGQVLYGLIGNRHDREDLDRDHRGLTIAAEREYAEDPVEFLLFIAKFLKSKHEQATEIMYLREELKFIFAGEEVEAILQSLNNPPDQPALFPWMDEKFSQEEKELIRKFFDSEVFRQAVKV